MNTKKKKKSASEFRSSPGTTPHFRISYQSRGQQIAQSERNPDTNYASDRTGMRKVLHRDFYKSVTQAVPMMNCPVTSCAKRYSGQDGKITGLRSHITVAIKKDPNDGHRLLYSLLKERVYF